MVVVTSEPHKPPLPLQKRVLYIGSAVPLETSEGLEAIQQPLRDRYPVDGDEDIQGIDAILTILPNGLQLQYVGDDGTVIWFPITSLTLCAAVRCIHLVNGATGSRSPKFVSLSSPASGGTNSLKPAIFTAITRRTTGRKVLECHGFVCSMAKDAMELVHSTKYADAQFDKNHPNVTLPNTPNGTVQNGENTDFVSPPFEQPIKLQPADEDGATVTQQINGAPPPNGYFYSGGNNLVKRFTISRLTKDEPPSKTTSLKKGQQRDIIQPPHLQRMPQLIRPYGPRNAPMFVRHPVTGRPMLPPYYMNAPLPMNPYLRPVRHAFPPPPNGYHRAYNSLPRDPHVFQPPPPLIINAPYSPRNHTSRTVSESDSITRVKRPYTNESDTSAASTLVRKPRNKSNKAFIQGHESSSDESRRPKTPPADYDKIKTQNRMSRKDQHERMSRRDQHEMMLHSPPARNGYMNGYIPTQFRYPHPLYDGQSNGYYVAYPQSRAKSMPPFAFREPMTTKSLKKSKKDKAKKKHNSKKRHNSSEGYMSDAAVGMIDSSRPRRDSVWMNNQFGNEKAFSQSLKRDSRRMYLPEATSAYTLNQPTFDREDNLDLKLD